MRSSLKSSDRRTTFEPYNEKINQVTDVSKKSIPDINIVCTEKQT